MSSMSGGGQARNCVSCGRSIAWDANVCQYCGHDYRAAMAGPGAQKKESPMPLIAGILLILCAIGYLTIGGIMAAGGSVLWDLEAEFSDTDAGGIVVGCGILVIVLGVIVLLGAIFSIQKKHFGLALVGAILTIPSILGIIALILIIVAREEFR